MYVRPGFCNEFEFVVYREQLMCNVVIGNYFYGVEIPQYRKGVIYFDLEE